MTHLRQKMLDELQRRNYSQNTVYTYLHAVEDFSRYFHRSPVIIFGSIKLICFVIASFKRERSQRMLRPCAFSTSRHCDGRICPSTSHFPSVPGNCPLCSVQKRFSG